jgi:hypothetical protein
MPNWERKPLEIGRTKFKPTFKNLQFFFKYQIGMEVLLKRKNYTTLVKTKFLTIGITILNIYQKRRNILNTLITFYLFLSILNCPFDIKHKTHVLL